MQLLALENHLRLTNNIITALNAFSNLQTVLSHDNTH